MSQELSELERIWENIIRMRDLRDDQGLESRMELRKAMISAEKAGMEKAAKEAFKQEETTGMLGDYTPMDQRGSRPRTPQEIHDAIYSEMEKLK